MYITKNNSLIMKKKIIIDKPVSLLNHMFESHAQYKNTVAYLDADFFISYLEDFLKMKFLNKKIFISDMVENSITNEKYYPVNIKFTIPANNNLNETEINLVCMRIPEINEKGLINVNGKYLACLNELNKAPDLTIDEKKKYQLKTLDSSLNFIKSKDKYIINYKVREQKCTLAELAVYLACEMGELNKESDESYKVEEYINNTYSGIAMRIMTFQIRNMFVSTIYKKVSNTIGNLKLNEIRLGGAREAINKYFSIDNVIGQTLAKDINDFKKNTLITPDILEKLKEANINHIFIKYQPDLTGYYTAKSIKGTYISAGTKVSEFLLNKLPELKGYGYTPKDIYIDAALDKGELITSDINDFLNSLDLDVFYICKSKSSKDIIEIPFYKEVITNKNEISNKLTFNDLKALISYIAGTIEFPELYSINNRDSNFFKNAYTFCETLSNTYRNNIRRYINFRNAVEIKLAVNKAIIKNTTNFQKLIDNIIKNTFNDLYLNSLHREPDFKNPAALLSHSRRLVTLVPDNGATISMRTVMMGHYGRICPFDTPQSSKIGLTNSLAVRSKISDGIILTPYHPIVKNGSNYFVSRKINYLSSKEESKYKIGDIMSLDNENNQVSIFESPIINKIVKARVPSLNNDSELQTIESIYSYELDYVNVFEDQILSHCAALIPFIGSNDGARVTFACSMFRQAEAIIHSEKPYVYTGMYNWIINDTDYVITAKENGIIEDITPDVVKILYDNRKLSIEIPLKRQMIRTGNIVIMEMHKNIGDRIQKGDLIADSLISKDGMFTPGTNFLVAWIPYYGFNNEDGIVLTQNAANKLTSFNYNEESISLEEYEENKWEYKSYFKVGMYVGEGQDILCIKSSNPKKECKYLKARFGKTGIIHKITTSLDTRENKITFIVGIISVNELLEGDKMSGRHGNKGVVTLIEENSKAPSFLNGELVDIVLNPCGIPSRMNLGQELEAHLSFVCYLLDLHIRSDSFNGADVDEIMELLQFCYDIANSEKEENIINSSKYIHLPDIIKEHAIKRSEYIKSWKGCFFPDGTAYVINNRNGKIFANKVVIGNMYFLKLAHEVEHKRSERGGILSTTTYSAITKQPAKGLKNFGGQAIGEMELWAVLAHGANKLLMEMLHDKSDNIYIRNKINEAVKEKRPYTRCFNPYVNSNHATEIFQYLIEGMNGYINTNVGTDLSLENIKNIIQIQDKKLVNIDSLQKYKKKEDEENELIT